jgi:hypothetical protein
MTHPPATERHTRKSRLTLLLQGQFAIAAQLKAKQRKYFFFEKKKQKTFSLLVNAVDTSLKG